MLWIQVAVASHENEMNVMRSRVHNLIAVFNEINHLKKSVLFQKKKKKKKKT
jgi:hypothetical protein